MQTLFWTSFLTKSWNLAWYGITQAGGEFEWFNKQHSVISFRERTMHRDLPMHWQDRLLLQRSFHFSGSSISSAHQRIYVHVWDRPFGAICAFLGTFPGRDARSSED